MCMPTTVTPCATMTNPLPTKTSRRRKKAGKKSVSFFKYTEMFSADHEYCPKEVQEQLWYTQDELREFRHYARALRKDKALHGSIECVRGLETYLMPGRSEWTQYVVRSVLDAQREQLQEGFSDPMGLRSVSTSSSKESARFAVNCAVKDTVVAYDIYREHLDEKMVDDALGKKSMVYRVKKTSTLTARMA